jgi:hypothetical protein
MLLFDSVCFARTRRHGAFWARLRKFSFDACHIRRNACDGWKWRRAALSVALLDIRSSGCARSALHRFWMTTAAQRRFRAVKRRLSRPA